MQQLDLFFLDFGLLAMFALLGGLVAARWRQPTVVGLLLVGALMGPGALGVISDDQIVSILAEFGAALLLFSIGVEFSLSKLLGTGAKALVIASMAMLFGFFGGYEVGLLFGLDYIEALLIGACLSFTSTAIVTRVLLQANLLRSPAVPLIFSALVIEDIAAVVALTFFSTISDQAHPGIRAIIFSVVQSLAIIGFVYLVIDRLFQRFSYLFKSYKTEEGDVLLAFALCVLFSFAASGIGLPISVGAFLAGNLVSTLIEKQRLDRTIAPFSLAFSSFFFLSIGLAFSLPGLLANLPLAICLLVAFVVATFLGAFISTYLTCSSFEEAVFAGASMTVIGEFSLLLARQSGTIVDQFDLTSVMVALVISSTVISSFLLSNRPALAAMLRRVFRLHEIELVPRVCGYASAVVAQFEADGPFLRVAHKKSRVMLDHFFRFAIVGVVLFILRKMFDASIDISGYPVSISFVLLAIALALLLPTLIDVLRELRIVADAVSTVFVRFHYGEERTGRRIARNFLGIVALFGLLAIFPLALSFLRLPELSQLFVFFSIVALVFLALDTLHLVNASAARKKQKQTTSGK